MIQLERKTKVIYVLVAFLLAALLVIDAVWPKTGDYVLVGACVESAILLLITLVILYVFLRILLKKTNPSNRDHDLRMAVIGLLACVVLLLVQVIPVARDLSEGSKQATLTNCSVYQVRGFRSIRSRYYLKGYDAEDESVSLAVSSRDRSDLEAKGTVRVDYYEHTGRLISYHVERTPEFSMDSVDNPYDVLGMFEDSKEGTDENSAEKPNEEFPSANQDIWEKINYEMEMTDFLAEYFEPGDSLVFIEINELREDGESAIERVEGIPDIIIKADYSEQEVEKAAQAYAEWIAAMQIGEREANFRLLEADDFSGISEYNYKDHLENETAWIKVVNHADNSYEISYEK